MSSWKPKRKKKDESTASNSRLISCGVLIAGGLVILYFLFVALLKSK